jgi:hypothetical protein
MEALLPLARYCCDLKQLRIIIYPSAQDISALCAQVTNGWHVNESLAILDVGMSSIDPALGVSTIAEVLSKLFPNWWSCFQRRTHLTEPGKR